MSSVQRSFMMMIGIVTMHMMMSMKMVMRIKKIVLTKVVIALTDS